MELWGGPLWIWGRESRENPVGIQQPPPASPHGSRVGSETQCNFGCGELGWVLTPLHASEKPKMLHGEVLPMDGLDKKGGDWQNGARTWLYPHVGRGTETLTMVSSMGYVVLSGKMQVERQETTFCTPHS